MCLNNGLKWWNGGRIKIERPGIMVEVQKSGSERLTILLNVPRALSHCVACIDLLDFLSHNLYIYSKVEICPRSWHKFSPYCSTHITQERQYNPGISISPPPLPDNCLYSITFLSKGKHKK